MWPPGSDEPERGSKGGREVFRLDAPSLGMAGLVQRTARAIDDSWHSIWHESSRGEKIVIAILLLITGLAIPVIPIVWIARIIAN